MITKYITQITAHFNPLSTSRAHRIPRLLLSRIPSTPRAGSAPIKVATTVLPSNTTLPASVTIAFKDGKQLAFAANSDAASDLAGAMDLAKLSMSDVVEELDRHSRVLRRKEEISG